MPAMYKMYGMVSDYSKLSNENRDVGGVCTCTNGI